jgi:hypothetical protein
MRTTRTPEDITACRALQEILFPVVLAVIAAAYAADLPGGLTDDFAVQPCVKK